MSSLLKIVIAEPSVIIRSGLEAVLKHLPDFRLQITELSGCETLVETLRVHKPDCLIINPGLIGHLSVQSVKEEAGCAGMKCMTLEYAVFDPAILRGYDDRIHIFDGIDTVKRKFEFFREGSGDAKVFGEEQQTLSQREKEIVVCVVKGMTNHGIAEALFLSTHTVITHRRNIARKLQIHSASGLTIYAIMNKLVELSDIQ
ncbi:Nitrogen regulation protein C [Bacteroidales bacterium Barb4]|nr:Nitrogen regulation protein C [Bacteroidales bacterium Barb4]